MVIITSIFQAMFGWRKSCEELIKRMDPDLPYYYHTSTHNRFYEDELPKFDEPAHRTKKQRPPRRELLSGSVGGRVTLAPRGSVSIRTQFHNVPVDLPSPPSQPSHTIVITSIKTFLLQPLSVHQMCNIHFESHHKHNQKKRKREGEKLREN